MYLSSAERSAGWQVVIYAPRSVRVRLYVINICEAPLRVQQLTAFAASGTPPAVEGRALNSVGACSVT